MLSLIIGLLIVMLFSAFFSGMEIAFVSSNRLLVEMDREKDGLSQKAIALFYQHPNNFVSTMLVGNNIALVIYGILFAKIFDATLFYPLSDGLRVTADTLLSTIVVLFTGEFIPKTIFKNNPNTMLNVFAVPAYVCYILLYPISRFATLLSKGLLPVVGIPLPIDWERAPKQWMQAVDFPSAARCMTGYCTWLKAFCGAFGLTYLDFAADFLLPDGTPRHELFWDGLHPNAEGHQLMARRVLSGIDLRSP